MPTHRSFSAVPAEPPRPAFRSSEAALRVRALAVLVTVGLAAVAGPLSLLIVAKRGTPKVPVPAVARARGAAAVAALDWLEGREVSVPTVPDAAAPIKDPDADSDQDMPTAAESAPWTLAWQSFEATTAGTRRYEINWFLASTPGRAPVWLAVTMDVTGRTPLLAAAPAVSSFGNFAERDAPPLDYGGVGATDVPSSVRTQVAEWARAFVTGDAAAVKKATLDPDPSRRWEAGLGAGWKLAKDTPVSTPFIVALGRSADVAGSASPLHVARVELHLLTPAGVPVTGAYDLLLARLGDAQPHILAWGPAGSGSTLTPYANTKG